MESIRKSFRWLPILLVLISPAAFGKAHYLKPGDVDWKAILSGPPAKGSDADKADLDALLKLQADRTPEQEAVCKREQNISADVFADVLGGKFDEKHLPLTFKILRDVASDTVKMTDEVKDAYKRTRPPAVDSRVHPCVHVETSGSYPSSHASRGVVWGAILAELYPAQKDKLLARGKQIGQDRLIAGIHFPTDVKAGQDLGDAIAKKLFDDKTFLATLETVKAEIAGAKQKGE